MPPIPLHRRKLLKGFGALAASSLLPACGSPEASESAPLARPNRPFTFCLNTSTIRGQNLGFLQEFDIAAEAGYDGIEIWLPALQSYLEAGGSTQEVRQRAADLGLQIENAIGFARWIVDDEATRQQAMEQARSEMEVLAEIGCKRIAAPPAGATEEAGLDLRQAAARYRALLELGDELGVRPQLEVWGFSANLHLLGQALFVAVETGHPHACLLPDVYHLFRGGSGFGGMHLLSGTAVEMFHMNDYPASPPREEMDDSHRVYPGDGIAPLDDILQALAKGSTPTVLSLELFNRSYWEQDAQEVARTGLQKMKQAVEKALA